MKFIHLADLHLGKRVHEISLIRDQEVMLQSIRDLCAKEKPEALLIAGDVFDKAIPSLEAVRLLETFLEDLSRTGLTVFLVAGNHDSGERLAFGSAFFGSHGIHVAGVYEGRVERFVLQDSQGPVTLHLLPFIRLSDVRKFFPDRELESVEAGVAAVLSSIERGPGRHVLVAHQFVTARGMEPLRSDSEILQVGLADEIDASVFAGFDYVALGHLHRRQQVGPGPVHYAGSPLAYSFSEAGQVKGALLVDLPQGGDARVSQLPLAPLHSMRRVRGKIEELIGQGHELEEQGDPARLDYLEVTLTDEGAVTDPMNRLKTVYPNIMRLLFDRGLEEIGEDALIDQDSFQTMDLADLFSRFFLEQAGRPLTESQLAVVQEVAEKTGAIGETDR
ncbi:MAG: exonuclease SbcCD subunit D [Clostridiaceae bacterium]|nr:exonuclease SbcCD subunit D [Clostridiaceae bacterium]